MRARAGLMPVAFAASAMIGGHIDAAWAQGSVPIGLIDCGANGGLSSPVNDPNYFIATHFNFILDEGYPSAAEIAAIKAQNANLLVFGYFGATSTNRLSLPADTYFYDTDPGPLNGTYVGTAGGGYLVTNPASQDWINYSVNYITSTYFANGYDGVLLDSVTSNPQWGGSVMGTVDASGNNYVPYTTPPSWDNSTWWDPAWAGYLGAVRTQLLAQYPSKLMIFNGINEYPAYGGSQYVGIQSIGSPPTPTLLSDGFDMEGFATSDAFSPAPPANPWVATDGTWLNMELAMWNNSQNPQAKIVTTAVYGEATQTYSNVTSLGLRMYALSSFLLAYSGAALPQTYFSYETPFSCTHISYFPEWELNYGTPTANAYYDSTNNVYRRPFTNGEVFVNPSSTASTGTITFPNQVYLVTPSGGNIPGIPSNLGGDNSQGNGSLSEPAITSLTLPPYSAAIVLNAVQ